MKFNLKLKISFSSTLSIISCRTKIDLLETKAVNSFKKSSSEGVVKTRFVNLADLGLVLLLLLDGGFSISSDCCLWTGKEIRFEEILLTE